MKEKKIIICGTAPSSMQLAPQGGDWTVWSCSPGTYGHIKADKWFEIHRWEPGQTWFSEGYVEFLKNFDGEVMMSQQVNDVKGCTLLPVDELVERYGPYFFTSTIAYMLAMAIDEGATKIALYGVDMAASEEYGYQRAGCQYFAQIAASRGIEIGVPPESDLFRPAPLYGVCETSHNFIKITARKRELTARLQESERLVADHNKQILFVQGALDDLQWNEQTWHGNMDTLGQEFTGVKAVPALSEVNLDMAQTIADNLDSTFRNNPHDLYDPKTIVELDPMGDAALRGKAPSEEEIINKTWPGGTIDA